MTGSRIPPPPRSPQSRTALSSPGWHCRTCQNHGVRSDAKYLVKYLPRVALTVRWGAKKGGKCESQT